MAPGASQESLLRRATPEKTSTKAVAKKVFAAAATLTVIAAVLLCYYNLGKLSTGRLRNDIEAKPLENGEQGEVVESEVGVVATDDKRCSEVGASVLKNGGHAVDSAVATTFCLGVVNPMASGIGGGGFMVFRSARTGQAQAYNFRETAPLAATLNTYVDNPKAKLIGPLSIGVPGEIAGLYQAWLQHGRLPWKSLFQSSIKLARHGFEITSYLSAIIKKAGKLIMLDPGLREVLAPGGKLLQTGDICYNPKLADTLEVISEQGPQAFYNGTIGERLVRDVQEVGGILTMEDLRQYTVGVGDAMAVNNMGFTILGMPLPSSGTVGLGLILNILESFGTVDSAKSLLSLHRLLESIKHMLAVRMNLGDPNFVDVRKVVSDMLSMSYAEQIMQKILDNTTFPAAYYLAEWSQLRDHGTSHLCIVDADRNVLSLTTTINSHFGAAILSPATGIVLNNELDDFSVPGEPTLDKLPPAPSNYIQPNKRPLSSMSPIIVLKDNQVAGAIGASGGLYIIPAVTQVFLSHFVLGMDPLAAVQHPRVYHKLIPNVVLYENWTFINGDHIEVLEDARLFLEQRGHVLKGQADGGICQLVVQNLDKAVNSGGKPGEGWTNDGVFHGMLTAVSDPRKDGRPAAEYRSKL
ncbi:hypothetical protein H6P81_002781 [Aristolochia fimbriata]|uniref:Glutathione hydrolase n=1 Tax=Aristolochia fimbriata TaxID=158543 RepID=A0AAV7FAZ1_ARIFI|nr:hypothetical protein H6P81_002781 [Aristolochia fimbriata]